MMHSFYAIMGGFVFDTKRMGGEPFIPGSPRIAVTSKGIYRLAQINITWLPDISKNSIRDRSKADNLAKSLVCLQAGWMIVQCITRVVAHLPVTFLEINTLGHVVCALLMYILWWHKPLEVSIPTRSTLEPSNALEHIMRPRTELTYLGTRSHAAYRRLGSTSLCVSMVEHERVFRRRSPNSIDSDGLGPQVL